MSFKKNRNAPELRRTFELTRVYRGNLTNDLDDGFNITASGAATQAAKDDGENILHVAVDVPEPGCATVVCKNDVTYIARPKEGPPQKIVTGTY